MIIEINTSAVTFISLKRGDVFRREDNKKYYIKCDDDGYLFNAVDLESGTMIKIHMLEKVYFVRAKMIVDERYDKIDGGNDDE